jgi:chaperonin GroEL (HSP60 family)
LLVGCAVSFHNGLNGKHRVGRRFMSERLLNAKQISTKTLSNAPTLCIRRVRKTDSSRIALAVGATIVNRVEDVREGDVGTQCRSFKVEKIGDERVLLLSFSFSPLPHSSP